jgi:hypothetical protein
MLFQQNIEQVDVALASTTITTSPITTLAFDTEGYAIEDFKVPLDRSELLLPPVSH